MEELNSNTTPEFTEDINEESLLQFLSELSVLREKDPNTFKRVLSAAGIPDETDLKTVDVSSLAQALKESSDLHGGLKLSRKDEVKSIDITPVPGFTLKTIMLSTKQKVFINVCCHDSIFEPGLKKKLNDQNEEIEGWNIPMSIGPSRNDVDHAGVGCLVHDIIVHPKVVGECEEDKTGKHRDFICQLSLQCLEQKFEYQLNRKYKLPKAKYKGSIASQRVQDRRAMPQIVELSSKDSKSVKHTSSQTKAKTKSIVAEEKPMEGQFYWRVECSAKELEMREVTEFVFSSDYVDPVASLDESIRGLQVDFTVKSQHGEPISPVDLQLNVSAFKLKVTNTKRSSQ